MTTFSDNAKRTWTIDINVDAIRRVCGLMDIDLLDIVDGKLSDPLARGGR